MPDAMSHFFKLCGTCIDDHLDLVPLEPAYRVIDDHGEFIDVTSDIDAMVELFESREPGAGAKLRAYIDSATQVYNLAIDGFLYTNFTNFIPYLSPGMLRLLPKLLASLSTSLKVKVNTQFRDTKLRQILSYPAVFLSSDPSHTPALYHLMSHTDLVQGVSYPRGGFTAFIKALISLIDDAVLHLGTPVSAITTQGRNATGVQVGSEFIEADIVISCADQHHTETQLLPASLCAKPETSWKNKQPGLSTVLVLAGEKGEHTLLFSSDWDEDFRKVFDGSTPEFPASESIYISKTSATDSDAAPEGHENLFILVPVPADVSIGHGSAYGEESDMVGRIAIAAVAQIGRWAGIDGLESRIVVQRTIGLSHTLAQSAFFRRSNKSRKVDGLYYAGATTVPGVGVPMRLISAENVLKRLRGDNSVDRT